MKGFSITLAFGKYGGFHTSFGSYAWRICLGWAALTVYPRTDIEEYMKYLKSLSNTSKNESGEK